MRLRLDGMPDAIFRGLQLAWLLHSRCKLEVFWVPGLRSESEKIDLDDLLALSDAERAELTATYQRRIAEPLSFAALLGDVPELGPYHAEAIELAERMYAAMRASFEAGVADPAGASTVLAREAPLVFEQARAVDRGARALFDKKQLVERLVGAPAGQ
jgi:hypothetical protein